MAGRTVSIRFAVEGEDQYRQSMKNINADLKTQKSELELLKTTYQGQQNSMAALEAKGRTLASMYDTQKQKVQQAQAALDNAKNAQNQHAQAVETYKTSLSAAQQELDRLKTSTGDTAQAQERQKQVIADLTQKLQTEQAAQQAAAQGVQSWTQTLNYAQRDLGNLDMEIQQNNQYLTEARRSADGCASSIDEYGNAAREAAAESEEFGDTSTAAIDALATALATAGIAKALGEIKDALKDCVDTAGGFESQMSTVAAISGASGEDMAKLSEKAKEMGATTSFTAVEAGQGLEYMAMAGWKTEDMLNGLPGIMNLAAASGEQLGMVSDIVTDALTALGLTAADSARFADVLAAASSNSNTNVAMMGETFKYAGAMAGSLGYSMEDTALMIGLMANTGIKASMAGTALNAIMTRLATDTKGAATAIEKIGVDFYTTEGKARPLRDVMGELRVATKEYTDEQKSSLAKTVAGVEAQKGLLAILNASEADYRKLADAIDASNGAAQTMAEIRLDNYQGSVTLLESAMEGLKIQIGDNLLPVMTDLADAGANAAAIAQAWVADNPQAVHMISALTAGFAVLTAGIVGYTAVTKAAAAAQVIFNAALSNPVVMAISGIAALAAAVGTYVVAAKSASGESDGLRKKLGELKTTQEETAHKAVATASAAQGYVDKLAALESQTSMTRAEQLDYKQTVEQLGALMPDLNLELNEQTGLLKDGAEALRVSVEQWRDLAIQQALQDRYQGVLEGQANAIIDLTEKELALKDAQEHKNEIELEMVQTQERLNQLQQYSGDDGEQYAEREASIAQLQQRMGELTGEYQTAKDAVEEQDEAVRDATHTAAEYDTELARLSETQEAMAEAATSGADELEEANTKVKTALETVESKYKKLKKEARESIDEQIGKWDEMDNKAKTSAAEVNKALQSQITYLQNYTKNLENLSNRNIDGVDALVTSLSDGSEESAAILAGLAGASDKEIKEVVANLGKVEEGKENFSKTVALLEPEMKSAMNAAVAAADVYDRMVPNGENAGQGVADGVHAKRDEVWKEFYELGLLSDRAFKAGAEIKSPSRKMIRNGGWMVLGVIKGTEEKKSLLWANMAALGVLAAQAFAEKAKLRIDPGDAVTQAKTQIEAYTAEIEKQKEHLASVMQQAGDQVKESFVKAGMDEDTAEAFVNSYEEMLDSTVESVKTGAAQLQDELDKIQDQWDDAVKAREAMTEKLAGYGDLYTEEDGKYKLEDLDAQIAKIKEYNETISALRDRGLSDGLISEVIGYGVDDAVGYGEELLSLTDEQFEAYNAKWQEKQELAKQTATEFYQSEIDALQDEYNSKLASGLDEIKKTTFDGGADAIKKLIEGIQSERSNLITEAQATVDAVNAVFATMNTGGGSGGGKVDGSHASGLTYVPYDNYRANLHKGERVLTAAEAREYREARTPAVWEVPQAQDNTARLATMIGNVITTAIQALDMPSGDLEIHTELDGVTFARTILPDFRRAADQSPEIRSDV